MTHSYGARTVNLKFGIENKTSTEKGNTVIETFVLKTVVLALKQVLALKKETN